MTRRNCRGGERGAANSSLLFAGAVLLLLGLLCMAAPLVVARIVTFVIGFVLLAAGFAQLLQAFWLQSWSDRWFPLVAGVLTGLCGMLVLLQPLVGFGFLSFVIGGWFLLFGVWKCLSAYGWKPRRGWLWLLLQGLLSLLLGVLFFVQWPLAGPYALGLLVGLGLFFEGLVLLALGYASDVRL